MESQALIKIDIARRALAEATTVREVKDIRDKAEAVRIYLKQKEGCLEAQNNAADLKLRAERKIGWLLEPDREKRGGDQKSKLHDVTLKSLPDGISRIQSHRYQRIASVPEPVFEKHVATVKERGDELTTVGVLRVAKELDRQRIRKQAVRANIVADRRIDDLVFGGAKFGTIYADPPWPYDNQATRAATSNGYVGMTIDEICALPIKALAADDAHLHLWTTNGFLFDSLAVIQAWGFDYKSCFVWVKPQIGIGNYWRVAHEFLLLGVRGNCAFLDRAQRSWIEEDRTRKHSQKPRSVRRLIEKVSPGPRLELFAREQHEGWTVWGNEV